MDERSWTVTGQAPLRFWGQEQVSATPEAESPAPSLVVRSDAQSDTHNDTQTVEDRIQAAEHRAQAAERDRNWWMAQHDAVMKDWRLDIAILQPKGVTLQPAATPLTEAKPDPAPTPPTPVEADPPITKELAQAAFVAPSVVTPVTPVTAASVNVAPGSNVQREEALQLITDLVQFFDPRDGSIVFQREGRTLSEAFKRASMWIRAAK